LKIVKLKNALNNEDDNSNDTQSPRWKHMIQKKEVSIMTHRIQLSDAYKQSTHDQDKTVAPWETVRRVKERLAQVEMDILTETRRIDNGRLDIPVFFSVCGEDARRITGTRKQMGKGATPEQAEASAVMELVERFSFFSFCNTADHFQVDTHRNLGDRAIPFELVAASVHDDSRDIEAARRVFETLPMKWTRAYNLTREQEMLVPFDWFFTINEFNGPSAGNCPEEALSQGICEVIERHVSSLISRKRLTLPMIRPESATDDSVIGMLGKYQREGIRLFLSDFSLDTGIPTIGALAYDPATFPEKSEIVWTAGTTPSPEKALSRALTEVAQLAGDFNSGGNYLASGLPKFGSLEEAAYVIDGRPEVDLQRLPDLSHPNIKQEVLNLVSTLSEREMEVIVIDTRHPLIDIPAFYTLIPGAHFRERAEVSSVGMFTARIVTENLPVHRAIAELKRIDDTLPGRYYVRFYMAMCRLNMGETRAALDGFKSAMSLEPPEEDAVSIYSYMGVCLRDMGHYEEALNVLAQGLRLDRDRTDLHNLMGFCLFKLKRHEEAIASFEEVLRLDPGSAIDYANIGSNHRELGNTEAAVRYYRAALEIDPTLAFARENLERLSP
jgi:ribosomal protein S12 methylthiotransferase accessory factor